MLAVSQWQPDLGVCPQDTIYSQALPSHLSFPNSEPLHANFNSMPSSGLMEHPSEEFPLQMSSEMLDAIPAAPSATANMLPVGQRVPTSGDWEFHRHTIVQLYVDEDRTLKDVMQIMRTRHSFNATVKMYKTRLANWGARKYMTRAEREVACHVMRLKQAAGQTPGKVIVRGKARNVDVFLRHMGQSRVGVRGRLRPMNSEHPEDIVIDDINTHRLRSQVWPTMYPAGPQRTVEIVCNEMLSLVVTTRTSGSIFGGQLFAFLWMCSNRFDKNRPADVRVLLNRAAICFACTVEADPAEALLGIVQSWTALVEREIYASEFLACFKRHLLDLTRDRYGLQHSLTKLLMHILRMEIDVESMQHMYQSLLSMITSTFTGRRTPDLWQWNLELADSFEHSGQHRKAGGLLLDTVNLFDSETSQKDTAKMRCSFYLARHYIVYQQEMDDEAERILIKIREAGTDGVTGEVDPYYAYVAASGLAQLAEKRGDDEAAISFYRLEIQAAHDEWGAGSSVEMNAAADLADYLWELGREEEAIEADSLLKLTDEFSELDLE